MKYQTIRSALQCFYQGYSVNGVARRFRIPVKQARQLQHIYWQQEEIADRVVKRNDPEITRYYKEELAHERCATVERFLETMRSTINREFSSPDDRRVWQKVSVVLGFIPEVKQVLVFPPGGIRVVHWTAD